TFSTPAGAVYTLQASPNLVGPWTNLVTNTGTGGRDVYSPPAGPPASYLRIFLPGASTYSLNQAGYTYVNVPASPGYATVFNPFVGVTLDSAMPNPPDGTEAFLPTQVDL